MAVRRMYKHRLMMVDPNILVLPLAMTGCDLTMVFIVQWVFITLYYFISTHHRLLPF
jgi:hypothetical protein